MDIPPRLVHSPVHSTLLQDVPILQDLDVPPNLVVSIDSGATSLDCVSLDLSDPFAIMLII